MPAGLGVWGLQRWKQGDSRQGHNPGGDFEQQEHRQERGTGGSMGVGGGWGLPAAWAQLQEEVWTFPALGSKDCLGNGKSLLHPASPSPWTASMALGLASSWGRDPNMWEEEMMVT